MKTKIRSSTKNHHLNTLNHLITVLLIAGVNHADRHSYSWRNDRVWHLYYSYYSSLSYHKE